MALINTLVAFALITVGSWLGFGAAALCVAARDRDLPDPESKTYDEEYEGEN